jgi:hypothetical protein
MAKNQATKPEEQSNDCCDLGSPFGITEATLYECNIGCNSGFATGEKSGNTGCGSCCVFCLPFAFLVDLLKMPYSGIKAVVKACSKDVPQN